MALSNHSLVLAICMVAIGACSQSTSPPTSPPSDGGEPTCVPDLELIAGNIHTGDIRSCGSCSYADGSAAAALFNGPTDMELDPEGNIWVADTWNNVIRKITPDGIVSTVAGVAGEPGSLDGTGSGARFNRPSGITRTPDGNFYIADSYSETIRELTPSGEVTTIAGRPGIQGGDDGTGAEATFYQPASVIYGGPNYYVVDQYNNTVRSIDGEAVSTIAGLADVVGSTDGFGSAARFDFPLGIAISSEPRSASAVGTIYVTDVLNDTIRKIVGGEVTTIAGSPGVGADVDGVGSEARFAYPRGIAFDAHGNMYISEQMYTSPEAGHLIRKLVDGPTGWQVTTIGGGAADGTSIRLGTDFALRSPLALRISGTSLIIADTNAILELKCAVSN